GHRGLPGGSSLPKLLASKRGVRKPPRLPLTEEQIWHWAQLHRQRTGRWPRHISGPIQGAPGETWAGVHESLRWGRRGLPKGSSLAQLLAKHKAKADSSPHEQILL